MYFKNGYFQVCKKSFKKKNLNPKSFGKVMEMCYICICMLKYKQAYTLMISFFNYYFRAAPELKSSQIRKKQVN